MKKELSGMKIFMTIITLVIVPFLALYWLTYLILRFNAYINAKWNELSLPPVPPTELEK